MCMDVDARLWRSFTAVAEELHYGRAAARLHITQPALSRQIHELERALGVTLFDRTSRRVVLSQAGRAVLTQARRALAESDRAIRLARLAAHGEAGELAIAALPAATLGLLPAIIRSYRADHPAIGITISESSDDEQLAALSAGRIDAGFLRAAAAPPGLCLETLLTEPLLAGLPADHRLARRDRIALSEMAGEPFVFFPRHRSVLAYDEFIASCRAAGFSPDVVQEASGISALGLVAAGLGVTIVAASYQALSLNGVRFVPVAGHDLALQVAWAAGNTNTALPAFLQTVRQIAGQAALRAELPLNRCQVQPGGLPADQPIGEVEDVQQAESHRLAAALEAEHLTRGGGVQDGFVDYVILAVPAADGLEPRDGQRAQQGAVIRGDLVMAVERAARPPRHRVLGVPGKAFGNGPKVTGFLGPEVAIDEGVHLLAAERWRRGLLPVHDQAS